MPVWPCQKKSQPGLAVGAARQYCVQALQLRVPSFPPKSQKHHGKTNNMNTQTIDRLYLELSQVATVNTDREIKLRDENTKLKNALKRISAVVLRDEYLDAAQMMQKIAKEALSETGKCCHECHCGTAAKVPHEIGKDGCNRFLTDAPVKLKNGNWLINAHGLPGEECIDVSEYTLRFQWGYFQHPCGCWSRHPNN